MTAAGHCLNISVQAPAQDGEANKAVGKYLADLLSVRSRSVSLSIGGKSRDKVFIVTGIDGQEAAQRIAKALPG